MLKFADGAFEDNYVGPANVSLDIVRGHCFPRGHRVADAPGAVRSRGDRHGNGRLAIIGGKISRAAYSTQSKGNTLIFVSPFDLCYSTTARPAEQLANITNY